MIPDWPFQNFRVMTFDPQKMNLMNASFWWYFSFLDIINWITKQNSNSKLLPHFFYSFVLFSAKLKGRTHDWIALFSWSNLSKTPFRYSNETYRVCRTFDEFLDSRKIFEKSSHGPKLCEKCHEIVYALQAKRFLIFKTRLLSQSGNYLKPLELNFQIRP